MKKIKLSTIIIVCILLTSCAPTVNKNINIKDYIVTGSNNLDYSHTNIYYNDARYNIAIENYKKAIKYNKENPYYYYNLSTDVPIINKSSYFSMFCVESL